MERPPGLSAATKQSGGGAQRSANCGGRQKLLTPTGRRAKDVDCKMRRQA